MKTFSLAILAATVVLASLFASPLIARQQAVTRFEYLRVATYGGTVQERGQTMLSTFVGYRACIAASADWSCRDFPQRDSDALRTMFVTLGNEGWELVSAGYDPQGSAVGNYVFKRRAPSRTAALASRPHVN